MSVRDMSSCDDFLQSQKSTTSIMSSELTTERNIGGTETGDNLILQERLPLSQVEQNVSSKENEEKQKKNSLNPSRFSQIRLGSMDFGTTEKQETKLQQYNAHMQEVQELLNLERLYLTQPAVQEMAIKVFKKQMRSKLEVQFVYKLMQNMEIFEQNTDIMSSETVTRDLVKYFQIQHYKKHHKLFDIDQYGDKFYIILSGSVYCLLPDAEKSRTLTKLLSNNYTNDVENVIKNKNQMISKIVKAHTDRPRKNSATISAMNSILDQDSSRYENKDEQEKQFIEQNYPQFKMAKIIQQGEAFGEIALLSNDSKRTATVVCREDSWVLSLSKTSFDQIMGNYKINVLQDNLEFLKTFEFFSKIPDQRLLGLLHSMSTHTYNKKTVIYTEKDPSSHIFFIKNGSVEISQLQNTFEESSSSQQCIPSSYSSSNLNQKIRIRRKTISSSSNMNNSEDTKQSNKSKNNCNLKANIINTDSSDSDQNTSLNNSLKEKEQKIQYFIAKEKNKSQKRIAIASLGKGSYFGEDEVLIHAHPKRKAQAVCQTGKTEIFSIEKKKLFDILKEYGQKERFYQDAKVRNEMRESRINKMLDNERDAKIYSTSYNYYSKNYEQMENEQLINLPNQQFKQHEQSLYYSSKNAQTQQISSQPSVGQITKNTVSMPSYNSNTNITSNTNIANTTTTINTVNATSINASTSISNNTSTNFLYHPYRRPSMTFVLDEVEKTEEFQKIYQKKKKIMETKNTVKLFTMKKDQYIFTINKILKEGNYNIRNGSLPHLQEKFQFQHTDHTKKSGIMNKYNIPRSSFKENSMPKDNFVLPSECTSPNITSRYLTPCQQKNSVTFQPLTHSNNKSSSMHISQGCSQTPSNNTFLSKQKIDSSSIFTSLLKTKQQKFEEQFCKSAVKSEQPNKCEIRQFMSPDMTKKRPSEINQIVNTENIKLQLAQKSIYNFSTRVAFPLQASTNKYVNV